MGEDERDESGGVDSAKPDPGDAAAPPSPDERLRALHIAHESKVVGLAWFLGTLGAIGCAAASLALALEGGQVARNGLGLAAALVVLAWGLQRFYGWTRPVAIALAGLAYFLAHSFRGALPLLALLSAYPLWLLNGPQTRDLFTRRYRRARSGTPHLRPRPGPALWGGLLAILLSAALAWSVLGWLREEREATRVRNQPIPSSRR